MSKHLVKYIVALLLFGLNGIVASHIVLGSMQIVFLRTLIGGGVLAVLALAVRARTRPAEKLPVKGVLFVVLSGVSMGGGWLCVFEAYNLIGVGLSTLLYYCGPVIVMALSPLVFGERLTPKKTACFAGVVIGVLLLNGGSVALGTNPLGIGLGCCAAVSYALLVIFNKKAQGVTGLDNAAIQMVSALVFVGFACLVKGDIPFCIPADSWIWVFVLGFVNTGLGCYLYFSPLSKLPAQTVAVCGYLEPLSAVVFSAMLLGETLGVVQLVGGALIIGGAILCELFGAKLRKAS